MDKSSVFENLRKTLDKLAPYAGLTGVGLASLSRDNFKLPVVGKSVKIRLDNMANFEYDLFSDVDLMRFVKINIKISSINPISIGIDIASQLFYFLDMINDIRGNVDIGPYINFFEDAGGRMVSYVEKLALPEFLQSKDDYKGFASFTVFTEVDDMIWPDSLYVNTSRHVINDLPYYLSAELINRYSIKASVDAELKILEIDF